MLYIKTEVKPSKIHGFGLFASEFIPTGTLIAQFKLEFAWVCTEQQYNNLPEICQQTLQKYGWKFKNLWYMDIDDSKYMNHSFTPNMIINTENIYTAKAFRDINIGEELTEDYRQFDPDFMNYGSQWT